MPPQALSLALVQRPYMLPSDQQDDLLEKLTPLLAEAGQIPDSHRQHLLINVDQVVALLVEGSVVGVLTMVSRFFAGQAAIHMMEFYSTASAPRLAKAAMTYAGVTAMGIEPHYVCFRTNNIHALRFSQLLGPRVVPPNGSPAADIAAATLQYIQQYYPNQPFERDTWSFRADYGYGYRRGSRTDTDAAKLLEGLVGEDPRSLLLVVRRWAPLPSLVKKCKAYVDRLQRYDGASAINGGMGG